MHAAIRKILVGFIAGTLIGILILGVGGRMLMRAVAIISGLEGGFSWEGSLEVVLVGLITGSIAGALYPIIHSWLFRNHSIKGLAYGLLVYLAFLLLPISGKGAARGFPELQIEIHAMFGLLFLLFGWALVQAYIKFVK